MYNGERETIRHFLGEFTEKLGSPLGIQGELDDMKSAVNLQAHSVADITFHDPSLSGPRWYNRFAVILPAFILGDGLKGANAEIMPLRPQLEDMLPRWQDLTMPVLIVQGDEDRLVHPGNADFLERMLVNSDVTYLQREGQGHFVLWEEAELIRDTLLEKFN